MSTNAASVQVTKWLNAVFNWGSGIQQHCMDILSCYNNNYNNIIISSRYDIQLTHWGRVTHICVGKITIIGSDNGLSPERRQAII